MPPRRPGGLIPGSGSILRGTEPPRPPPRPPGGPTPGVSLGHAVHAGGLTAWAPPRNLVEAVAQLALLERDMAARQFRFGQILNAVEYQQLWRQSQLPDFWTWFASLKSVSQQYARRLMQVARTYSTEEMVLGLGYGKAYQLGCYADVVAQKAEQLAATNAVIEGRPVSAHTRDTLAAATRNAIARAAAEEIAEADDEEEAPEEPEAPLRVPEEELARAERLRRQAMSWVRREGAGDAEVVVRRRDGKAWIYIQIPVDEIELVLDGSD